MPSTFIHDVRFFWDCLWQSTALLLTGGALSFLWARRPARAHRILLLAMIGCVLTPLMSYTVRQHGWGIPHPSIFAGGSELGSMLTIRADERTSTSGDQSSPANASSAKNSLADANGRESFTATHTRAGVLLSWRVVLVCIWGLLSALGAIRLLASLIRGYRLVALGQQVTDERILGAIEAGCAKLGLKNLPNVRISNEISCPLIWCWGRRPVLLVPDSSMRGIASIRWDGVLCHEISHWKRRDHFAALFAEVLVCALPWQPLAWWAKRRLGYLSERASDSWVLACGKSPDSYAESLLNLMPQRGSAFALSAVSYGKNLQTRIHSILEDLHSDPRPGSRWAWTSLLAMACVVLAAAASRRLPAFARLDATVNLDPVATVLLRHVQGVVGAVQEGIKVQRFLCG